MYLDKSELQHANLILGYASEHEDIEFDLIRLLQ